MFTYHPVVDHQGSGTLHHLLERRQLCNKYPKTNIAYEHFFTSGQFAFFSFNNNDNIIIILHLLSSKRVCVSLLI